MCEVSPLVVRLFWEMCLNAVIVHRGAVKVHSEEGVGTVFTIRVPLNYIV